jgi:hypothetical protein
MIKFLNASSLFTNFLGIFLGQEKGFITLCVHYLGVPSIFVSVPRAGGCVLCVWVTGGAHGQ